MLPTNANSFSRSTYISHSCPSSKMATRVSCGVAEITISFDIKTPHVATRGEYAGPGGILTPSEYLVSGACPPEISIVMHGIPHRVHSYPFKIFCCKLSQRAGSTGPG